MGLERVSRILPIDIVLCQPSLFNIAFLKRRSHQFRHHSDILQIFEHFFLISLTIASIKAQHSRVITEIHYQVQIYPIIEEIRVINQGEKVRIRAQILSTIVREHFLQILFNSALQTCVNLYTGYGLIPLLPTIFMPLFIRHMVCWLDISRQIAHLMTILVIK